MIDFPIIDSHVHLWDTDNIPCPWLDDFPDLNRKFVLNDYDKATSSVVVESFVFLECELDHSRAKDEARWVASLAQEDNRIKGIVPWAPIENGEGARVVIEELIQIPLIKGIRRLIQFEKDTDFCLRPAFIKGVQLLKDYDLSFDICISHAQLANTIKMVRQCPDVIFILDHIAKPDIKQQKFEPWKTELRELANMQNVFCKMSGLITEADPEKWTAEDLKPYIAHVIECFGFERIMYGSDWPVLTTAGSCQQWITALKSNIRGCSRHELRQLFHDNARRIYKL